MLGGLLGLVPRAARCPSEPALREHLFTAADLLRTALPEHGEYSGNLDPGLFTTPLKNVLRLGLLWSEINEGRFNETINLD